MNIFVGIVLLIAGIGVLAALAIGCAMMYWLWWLVIPVIGALVGGWFGFFIGLGLTVIIGLIVAVVRGFG